MVRGKIRQFASTNGQLSGLAVPIDDKLLTR